MIEHDTLIWAFIIAAIVVVLPYVLGPILLRFTLTQQAEPEVVPFPVDHPDLPEAVRDHFDNVSEEMEAVGFEQVAGLALPRQTPNVKAVILMFANRTTRDAAIATAIYADKLTPPLQTAYVEIISRHRDDIVVQTNNSKQIGAFPHRPTVTNTQLSSVQHADRLYRLHQAIAERAAGGAVKVLRLDEEFHGDAAAYLARAMREELDGQILTGYMYLTSSGTIFRPTWKGAFLMCWALLFPWKQIRVARRDRKERRLLAELRAIGE